MAVPQFITSPIEGHLSCFQFIIIMNETAINICVKLLYGHKFSNNKHLGVGLVGHMVRLCIALKETAKLLPKWLCHFPFLQSMNESSYCSTSLSGISIVSFLDFSHSNRCSTIPFTNSNTWVL